MTRDEPAGPQAGSSTDGDAVEVLRPADLRAVLARACDAFAARRDEIDALNVFPVPDGDTGTNLLLTARGALEHADDGDPASTLAKHAVLAARGNSGVIFSQVLRALGEAADGQSELDAARLAEALGWARDYAYDTVAKPVEGTMLTAISVAARAAGEAADTHDLVGMVGEVRDAIRTAVEHTVEQLDVLREAGVVDAGARGFEVFWLALHGFVSGSSPQDELGEARTTAAMNEHVACTRSDGVLAYRFEVQYLLDGRDIDVRDLRDELADLGDSVAVVDAGDVLNVHVHTDDVGAAIEAGVRRGRPHDIQVEHFEDQIAQREQTRRRHSDDVEDDEQTATGAVAVMPGPGLEAAAAELGAVVVRGGGGDLPSVADILNAVGETAGDQVLLLPGHANVVPSAYQAAEVSRAEGGRKLLVVENAASVPAVLAALAVFDPTTTADSALDATDRAAAACRSGEVVPAVRDAETPVGSVVADDPLAVVAGEVLASADDAVAALVKVAEHLNAAAAEVVTLVVGADVSDATREDAVGRLEALAPQAALDVVDGGQSPALFYLGVE